MDKTKKNNIIIINNSDSIINDFKYYKEKEAFKCLKKYLLQIEEK